MTPTTPTTTKANKTESAMEDGARFLYCAACSHHYAVGFDIHVHVAKKPRVCNRILYEGGRDLLTAILAPRCQGILERVVRPRTPIDKWLRQSRLLRTRSNVFHIRAIGDCRYGRAHRECLADIEMDDACFAASASLRVQYHPFCRSDRTYPAANFQTLTRSQTETAKVCAMCVERAALEQSMANPYMPYGFQAMEFHLNASTSALLGFIQAAGRKAWKAAEASRKAPPWVL